MRQAQLAQAETMAEGVDLSRAHSVTQCLARVYAAGVLAFIASSLFALRYGLERRLDLRQPLARILENSFGGSPTQTASLQKKPQTTPQRSPLQDAVGISTEDAASKGSGELDAAPDAALETSRIPDTDNSKKGSQ